MVQSIGAFMFEKSYWSHFVILEMHPAILHADDNSVHSLTFQAALWSFVFSHMETYAYHHPFIHRLCRSVVWSSCYTSWNDDFCSSSASAPVFV